MFRFAAEQREQPVAAKEHVADAGQERAIDVNLNGGMRPLELDHDLAVCVRRVYFEVETIPVVLSAQRPLAAARCLINKCAPYIRVGWNADLCPVRCGECAATSGSGVRDRSSDLDIAGGRESRGVLVVLIPPIALWQSGSRIRRSRIPNEIGYSLREIDRDPIRYRRRRLRVHPGQAHCPNQ